MNALTQPDVATALDGSHPVKVDPFAPVFLPFCFPLPAPTACLFPLPSLQPRASTAHPFIQHFPQGRAISSCWGSTEREVLPLGCQLNAYAEIQLVAAGKFS